MTPSTLFYAGSTTKAFTAAALSLLVDNSSQYSNIQWDTPVSSLIPEEFVLESFYSTKVTTVEDVLSHRTGLPRHDLSFGGDYADEDGKGGKHSGTAKDVVKGLRGLPMNAEPRTKYQ